MMIEQLKLTQITTYLMASSKQSTVLHRWKDIQTKTPLQACISCSLRLTKFHPNASVLEYNKQVPILKKIALSSGMDLILIAATVVFTD